MTLDPSELLYRPVRDGDADAIADLWCARRPQDPELARNRAREFLSEVRPKEYVLVAEEDGVAVAYARAVSWTSPDDAPPSMCPSGWYLLGISVREDKKRRGIGRALTAGRLQWLSKEGAEVVYYFADFDNEASIKMHEEFGFTPYRHNVTFPRMSKDSKPLVLHRLELNPQEGHQGDSD